MAGKTESSAPTSLNRDREERVRAVREKMQVERQQKLEELKAHAAAAQKFREQQQTVRQNRLEEMRIKEQARRELVDERRRLLQSADQERREALSRKNSEREIRLAAKRRNESSNVVFAFGSSTPRMLDPKENYWNARRTKSISNVFDPVTKIKSDSDGVDSPRNHPTSANNINSKSEVKLSASMYEIFHWNTSNDGISSKDCLKHDTSVTKPSPLSHCPMSTWEFGDNFSVLGPTFSSDNVKLKRDLFSGEDSLSKSLISIPSAARRRTDLTPVLSSFRDTFSSPRHSASRSRSGNVTPNSPTRPVSSLSTESANSSNKVKLRSNPRKPRPLSIASSSPSLQHARSSAPASIKLSSEALNVKPATSTPLRKKVQKSTKHEINRSVKQQIQKNVKHPEPTITNDPPKEESDANISKSSIVGYASEEEYKAVLAEKRRKAREAKLKALEEEGSTKASDDTVETNKVEELNNEINNQLNMSEENKQKEIDQKTDDGEERKIIEENQEKLEEAEESNESKVPEEKIVEKSDELQTSVIVDSHDIGGDSPDVTSSEVKLLIQNEEEDKLIDSKIEDENSKIPKQQELEERRKKDEEERELRKSRVAQIMTRTRGAKGSSKNMEDMTDDSIDDRVEQIIAEDVTDSVITDNHTNGSKSVDLLAFTNEKNLENSCIQADNKSTPLSTEKSLETFLIQALRCAQFVCF